MTITMEMLIGGAGLILTAAGMLWGLQRMISQGQERIRRELSDDREALRKELGGTMERVTEKMDGHVEKLHVRVNDVIRDGATKAELRDAMARLEGPMNNLAADVRQIRDVFMHTDKRE